MQEMQHEEVTGRDKRTSLQYRCVKALQFRSQREHIPAATLHKRSPML
jgi:hypothetical protein